MNDLTANLDYSRAEAENRLRGAGIACVFVAGHQAPAGRHLAFLVSEDAVAQARSATRNMPGAKVIFFTPSGAKSGGFRLDSARYSAITLAIFPFEIADYLLECTARDADLGAEDKFRLSAYVLAYFGGSTRLIGLPADAGSDPDLGALARAAGIDMSVCRDRAALDEYLAACGWRPPIDMLERLGLADPWIHDTLLPRLVDEIAAPQGLTVFFLRERAVRMGNVDKMRSAIEDCGFEILKSLDLKGDLATHVRRSVRGGNWGTGPWPINGGPPVQLLFAVDVFPMKPDDATRAQHPFLDNGRILVGKNAARNAVLSGLPSGAHFNALHSADNSAETLRFAKMALDAQDFAALHATFLARRAEVDTLIEDAEPFDGENTVALIVRPSAGTTGTVRKIYRSQYLDSLQCDAEMLETLAPQWPELPVIRRRSRNFIDIEDVGAEYVHLSSLKELAPIPLVLRMREILRTVVASGFDPVNWDPGQGILIAPTSGDFRILGFDRLKRQSGPRRLAESICLTGPAQGQKDGYQLSWYPILGMPRAIFVNGGPLTMRLYRRLVYPVIRGVSRAVSALELFKAHLRLPIRALRRMIQRPR